MRITVDAPRPVWDDFEFAIDCADRELRSYYDTVTGEVCVTGPFEDDPGERERIDADPARYLEIGHLDGRTEHEWMTGFSEAVDDPQLRARLQRAIAGPRSLRRFKDALRPEPAARERWFAFRDGLVKQWIEQWFAARDLAVGAPPTWWVTRRTD